MYDQEETNDHLETQATLESENQDNDAAGDDEGNANDALKPNADYFDSLTDEQIQRLAFENGFNPKGSKDARQFVADGLPYILSNKVLIKQLSDQINDIKSNQEKEIQNRVEAQKAYMKEMLKKEMAAAAEQGDTEKALQLLEKQEQIISQKEQTQNKNDVNPADVFAQQEFLRSNSWYNADPDLTAAFDVHYAKYLNAGYPVATALGLAQKEFKQVTTGFRNTDGNAKPSLPQGRTAKNIQNPSVKPRTEEALNEKGRAEYKEVLRLGRETFGLSGEKEKTYIANWLKRTGANNFVKGGA